MATALQGEPVFKCLLLLSSFAGFATMLHAQATATAKRAGDALVGAGYTSAVSDYGIRFTGFNVYGDFDFTQHFGVEANFHYAAAPSPNPLYEKTYEIGARYFRTYGPIVPYGKIMVGRGVFNYPANPLPAPQDQASANLAFNMYAIGAGLDLKVRQWLYVRGDYEYQKWPSFRGSAFGPANGLSPELFSVGAAYHFR